MAKIVTEFFRRYDIIKSYLMTIIHSNAIDPLRPMLERGLETSEGSIPSIGLGLETSSLFSKSPYVLKNCVLFHYRPAPIVGQL